MKTFSTKHIKKLQENTKAVDVNEVVYSKNYMFLVRSGKLGASLPPPPLRTVRVPFKTHRLKPPIAGPFAVVSSSHTITVSKTYADAPSGGIHNSTFLSSEDSHNLMFLRETNEK
jgi:hypothetical protein